MKKLIVITGATSGVGESLANYFTKLDWYVIGLARNEGKLTVMKNVLGYNFLGIKTDIRDRQQVGQAFKIIKQTFGNLDILINNASVFKTDEFINHTYNDIDSIIDTNLKGTIYCSLEAIKIMMQKNEKAVKRIINVASVSGYHGIENQPVYSASKHAVRGFADSLSQEVRKHNILVTTIFPGGINTPLWHAYPEKDTSQMMKTKDVVDVIKYIIDSNEDIIMKEISFFPKNEWH